METGTLTVDVRQLVLRQGEATLLSAAVAGDFTPGKAPRATGLDRSRRISPRCRSSRRWPPKCRCGAGGVKVKYDLALGDGTKGKIEISGQNLVARAGAVPLGSLDLSVILALDANNAGDRAQFAHRHQGGPAFRPATRGQGRLEARRGFV